MIIKKLMAANNRGGVVTFKFRFPVHCRFWFSRMIVQSLLDGWLVVRRSVAKTAARSAKGLVHQRFERSAFCSETFEA
jgi:hypothetical protein